MDIIITKEEIAKDVKSHRIDEWYSYLYNTCLDINTFDEIPYSGVTIVNSFIKTNKDKFTEKELNVLKDLIGGFEHYMEERKSEWIIALAIIKNK